MRSGQLNFDYMTKAETSIDIIRAYEPPRGYFLAFSGGKDSITIYNLAREAGVKFDAHYNRTGIDPPELSQFIRERYPDVIIEKPIMSMWKGIVKHGLPLRTQRWCCQVLKEHSGTGRLVMTGIRAQESKSRSNKCFLEKYNSKKAKQKYIGDKTFLHPILKWSTSDVWEYITGAGLEYCKLYDQGFNRIGCILCPFVSGDKLKREIDLYPKTVEAYRRAAARYIARRNSSMAADEYFNWWLGRKGIKSDAPTMFS